MAERLENRYSIFRYPTESSQYPIERGKSFPKKPINFLSLTIGGIAVALYIVCASTIFALFIIGSAAYYLIGKITAYQHQKEIKILSTPNQKTKKDYEAKIEKNKPFCFYAFHEKVILEFKHTKFTEPKSSQSASAQSAKSNPAEPSKSPQTEPKSSQSTSAQSTKSNLAEPSKSPTAEHYEMLGLKNSKDLTRREIKDAFNNLALIHHPDKGGTTEMFKKIRNSYQIVMNEKGFAL